MANIKGTKFDDFIHILGDGRMPTWGSNNITDATESDDRIKAGLGQDTIFAGGGDDTVQFNITTGSSDSMDLGDGADLIDVDADKATQVRLTFTSAEVGNGSATDSNTMANQDGGLAVRMQAEDKAGELKGATTRTDDEGVTFVADKGMTFDVRDLVSGVERGNQFEVVTLGTQAGETLTAVQDARPYYINAGQGNDTVLGGSADDFLVGGAGADVLRGGLGDDSFIGGGGDDRINGGKGDDNAIHNITTDGADQINLKSGADVVTVNATTETEVRLTFTSAEVGDGSIVDAGSLANQDGGLSVRMQAEDGSDGLTGPISRIEDESVTFVAGVGVKFDVRDLPTGTARGDDFEVVTLGSSNDDTLDAVQNERPYYINAGAGDDDVSGGKAADFLVGGIGDDVLNGAKGADSMIGGVGADTFEFSTKPGGNNIDTVIDFSVVDDTIGLDSSDFKGLDAGKLGADAFVIGTAAADAEDRIIYDSGTGSLLFDRDGSGDKYDAVAFATLSADLDLSQKDFVIG